MSNDERIDRRRWLRATILDILEAADRARLGIGLTRRQLVAAFRRQLKRGLSEGDLGRVIDGLCREAFIYAEQDPVLRDETYHLTEKGVDFRLAGCPWDRVDEFTGGR